ncbi:hypothetical protein SLNWT_1539 [Streptomyces albus]|uniref:Uncharacterized protein n=1 Tax=Streptomyces albus (strain ATCC 21838 / DSM 41398 / FERM P-419 / JCM 4703 / NBRC 107858) TaxID=1081613 RepID=A0A0B5ERL2_STRA4|nr:hypothetical protein SLNWT_1539 [Streptomyces albus]AOU76230.1 hypothetical protein SLNHY_1539 [Streptomyces albus]AYN32018.1 hypothetical protein DUI70_1516 [Streptomyces albus]
MQCLAARLVRPGFRRVFPGQVQSGGHVRPRPPMPVFFPCHPRPGGPGGWTAVAQVTYLRHSCGCRPQHFPPGGCAEGVRSCRTVMAWFSRGETLGRLETEARTRGQPLREGHGGVWRSDA